MPKISVIIPDFEIVENDGKRSFLSYGGIDELVEVLGKESHYYKSCVLNRKVYRIIYKEWLQNIFKGYSDRIFVIIKRKEIVGLLSLKKIKGRFYIDLFGVRKEYRGVGLGKALLNKAITYIKNLDFPEALYVYTHEGRILWLTLFIRKQVLC